jgi:hypothetical protein
VETDERPDEPHVVDLTDPSAGPVHHDEPASPVSTPVDGGTAADAPATPPPADPPVAVDRAEVAPSQDAPVASAADDELALLTRIEQDLAAVEEAMSGLDRVDADQVGGAAAAAQVAAVVGSDRFAVAD